MLYILYGQDDFSLREALEEMKRGLGDEDGLATNTTVLAGRDLIMEQLMAVCDTLPFLGSKRLVIVEGLLGRFETPRAGARGRRGQRRASPDLAGWLALKEYVARMPTTTALVLRDGVVRENNPLLRELAPLAEVKRFPPLSGDALLAWVEWRVAEEGTAISQAAKELLVSLIGGNLWVMSSEISKLCLYARGRRIEEEDVRLLVSSAREFTIFSLIDAIMEGRTSQATRVLHLLEGDAAAPYVIFMITRQFRLLVQARELLSRGVGAQEVGARLGLNPGYPLRKTLAQAQRCSPQWLEAIYRKLLEADISVKTGRLAGVGRAGELVLDLLVAELCIEARREGLGGVVRGN